MIKKNASRKLISRKSSSSGIVANFLGKARNNPVTAMIVIFIVAVLGFVIIQALAATVQPPPPGATSTCGATVANYTYRVPFAGSPWNTPTCTLPVFNSNQILAQEYGARLYNYGNAWDASSSYNQNDRLTNGRLGVAGQKAHFMTQFGLAGDNQDYGTPIYYATSATTQRKQIKICSDEACYPSNLDSDQCTSRYEDVNCMAPNATIPWDPSWKPSGSTDGNYGDDATDREMIIIDQTTGYVYELWRVNLPGNECFGRNIWYSLSGKNPDSRLCVGLANIIRDKDNKPANYYTYNQGVLSARGMGIQNAAMIVTPEEVAAGEIRHALTMEAFNTMFGPVCTPAQLSAKNYNILGKTCGYAVAPATTVEWGDVSDISRKNQCADPANQLADFNTKQTFKQLYTLDKTIPEGMRFKLNITNAEIDAWLDRRAADYRTDPVKYADNAGLERGSAKRNTARIFAIALRDYGWIVGDTTCYGAGFTIAGAANSAGPANGENNAKAKWASLGIADKTSQFLLDGLFTATNIIALDPPTSQCKDGSATQFYCPWLSSVYTTVNNVVSNQPPSVVITNPTTNTTVAAGTTSSNVAVSASDDSRVAKIELLKDGAVVSQTSTSSLSAPVPLKAGKNTLTAKATDDRGLVTTSSPIEITVPVSPTITSAPPTTVAPPTVTPSLPLVPNSPVPIGASLSLGNWRYNLVLKWGVSNSQAGGIRYTVKRNGTVMTTTTALNYTDTTLVTDVSYRYEVIATDSTNRSSTIATYSATAKCALFFCWLQ